MLAVALATGVLLDAFVVRMIVIPAALTLCSKASWWLLAWLDRLLPNIDTEGKSRELEHSPEWQSGFPVTARPSHR